MKRTNKIFLILSFFFLNFFALSFISCPQNAQTTEKNTQTIENNLNANSVELGDYSWLLSSAKINTENKYVAHSIEINGQNVLTYNFEWNSELKHAVWSGFYFDSDLIKTGTNADGSKVTRSDKMSSLYENGGTYGFQPDPNVENSDLASNHKGDGYDRGHIIGSADRLYNQDANNQTFYYTNMSPQIGDFNQGFWGQVENKVRNLSENALSSGYEKVYITKGGNTKNLLKNFTGTSREYDGTPTTDANGFSSKGLAVPSAYYIVMLAEKNSAATSDTENYITLGFYIPHQEGLTKSPSISEIQKYVYSIDYIENQTGLDFFCNLLDSVENEVESRSKKTCISSWTW